MAKKKSKKDEVVLSEHIAYLSVENDDDHSITLQRRVYESGRVMFVVRSVKFKTSTRNKTEVHTIEFERHEMTELLVRAFEVLRSGDIVQKMKEMVMPTQMEQ